MALNPTKTASNPRIAKLIELEVAGRIKPEHQQELDTYRAQGLAPARQGSDLTENQSKSTGFYERALGADKDFLASGVATDPRSTFGQLAVNNLPQAITNNFNSTERQLGDQAKEDFIRASLRYESGAAIAPSEFEGQDRVFFPQPGDSAEVIAQKAQARQRVIESLRITAGPGADQLRASNTVATAGDTPAQGFSLSPENEAKLIAFAPNASSAAEISAFARGMGVKIAPEEAQKAFDYYKSGGREAAQVDYSKANRALAGDRSSSSIDAAVRGAADTLSLGFADEIAAAGNTVFGGGTMADNLARERAINAEDERVNPYARLGGQLAGGFALPTGGATGARGLARIGALYGAGYGAGSAEGSVVDRLAGAAGGAIVGGATGGALGALGGLIPRGGGGGPAGGNGAAVMRAGQELGITPLAADVGGPVTGRLTSGVAQTLGGSGPIMRGARRVQDQAGERLAGIAASEGTPVRQEVLGETAQRAAQGYIDQSGRVGGELYREARDLAGNARIQGRQALDTLDANIAELSQTANTSAPVINGLQRFRDDLAVQLENGATGRRRLPVDAIRALRSNVRAEAQTEGLRATDYQRRANQVLDSLSEDIASQLSPDAAAAFRRADDAWRERLNVIDDVMEQVIGPTGNRSAEQVAQRLVNMSRGDSARLRTFINNINPEEAGVVRGSLIQELGRANSGQQNAAGDAFSLSGFLTNYDKLPDRTRNLLFRGDNRQAIENLATLAEGSRNAARFANTSNTGGANNASDALRSASAIAGWSSLGGTLVLENITARLLSSAPVARVLARPPSDRGRAIRRLTEAAVRDPAIQPDVNRLVQALNAGSNRAAAQQEQN